MTEKKNPVVGLVVGLVLVLIPEPATTITGAGIMAYSAYRAGWMPKL